MSSWLEKVSDLAGRAEIFLNQIDQNTAMVLNTTKSLGLVKSDLSSTVAVFDMDGQQKTLANCDEKSGSEIKFAAQPFLKSHHEKRSNTNSACSEKYDRTKKDEDLMAFLNDSHEQTSSRCSSVISRLSSANIAAHNFAINPTKFSVNSNVALDDIKSQHSDTLKCLHMKESRNAVMSVRLQEVEEENIKKDARIAELCRELETLKNVLAVGSEYSNNELSSNTLKNIHSDLIKERQEFKRRESEYMERSKTADAEYTKIVAELEETKKRISQLEMSEKEHVDEIRLARYNLEANKQEFDEYKQRAQKILAAKESLLSSLKENCNNAGGEEKVNNVEFEELRCERNLLKEDLQQSQFVIYNLKGDIQEMENRLRGEQEWAAAQRNMLLGQVQVHLSQATEYKEQLKEMQLGYESLQAEMRRQEEAVEMKLLEKDSELTKLKEEKRSHRKYEAGEVEEKISLISEKLIAKQTNVERLESEKRALELRLERADRACKNAEAAAIKAISIEMRDSEVVSRPGISYFSSMRNDSALLCVTKFVINSLDSLGLHLTIFLRSPVFRLFFLFYCILLHTWVFFILFTYTPEIHPL